MPHPERFLADENSYHCIYKNNYNFVNLADSTNWTSEDRDTCMTHCGVLDGSACPLYRIDRATINSATNQTEKVLLEMAANHGGVELAPQFLESYKIETYGKVYSPDIFLFSVFLAMGTLALSFTLKGTNHAYSRKKTVTSSLLKRTHKKF